MQKGNRFLRLKIDFNNHIFPGESLLFDDFHGIENHITVPAQVKSGVFAELTPEQVVSHTSVEFTTLITRSAGNIPFILV